MRWTLLLTTACVAPRVAGDPVLDGPTAILTTASDDYGAGLLATVAVDGWETADVATIHGDAVVTVEGGVLWEINRLQADTVRRYQPGVWAEPVWEASVGRGANPHDVASCGGDLYVSRHEEDSLLILDRDTGVERGTVDLSDQADADGLPEASDLYVDGDQLYVVLQRLDRDDGWSTTPGGRVVRVDCGSKRVEESWDVGPNPVLGDGPAVQVVSEDGVAGLDEGVWLTEVDGAVVTNLAFGDDDRGAFVARDGSRHVIGCVALGGSPTVLETVEHYISDVAVHDGQAWFTVRRGWEEPASAGGVWIVDLDTCTSRTGDDLVRTSLAPFSIAFVDP